MNVYAQRRARGVFAGNYGSVFKGRSLDFDNLREYTYGDDIKDIDWKASARSRNIMVRRYIAIRKHNILIVADNGNSMAALAPSGETKGEVATFCAGVVAYIARKHDDLVGLVAGNHGGNMRFPIKEETPYIEDFLNKYSKSIKLEAADSDINALLTYVTKSFRERMFIIVITDPTTALEIDRTLIRKLNVRHEQMYIFVEDSPLTNRLLFSQDARDIDGHLRLPHYYRTNRRIAKAETEYREAQRECVRRILRQYGIFSSFVSGTDDAIPKIIQMLEEQKHEKHQWFNLCSI